MACALPEKVDKQLTCAVCIEQFKEPKVLPCLHTYCKGCLVKLVRKQGADHVITCPECWQDAKVSLKLKKKRCQIVYAVLSIVLFFDVFQGLLSSGY